MRKLATVRRISALTPIANADNIELATVDGWGVVVRKNDFMVGDIAVYCEVDSWIPHALAPHLSSASKPGMFNGVAGQRLRTVRLRGQLSQGMLLSIPTAFAGIETCGHYVGDDCTEILGIQKFEPEESLRLEGLPRGNFPPEIPKPDQERCQNLSAELKVAASAGDLYEVTEKCEGSPCTMYLDLDGEFQVCSRNLSLWRDPDNALWALAHQLDVENRMMRANLLGYALQGEIIGPGVQKNIYGLRKFMFLVFDIYNVKAGKYLLPSERQALLTEMGLPSVPVLSSSASVPADFGALLNLADGTSVLGVTNTAREGVVYKAVSAAAKLASFKVISNQYLLKSK